MFTQFRTLTEVLAAFQSNEVAVKHFKAIRWRNGTFCPRCENYKIYQLSRKGQYRCAVCHMNFSATVGTIFESTKLPLRVWFGAIWLIASHQKAVGPTSLAADLGITEKSARFVLRRLRLATRPKSFKGALNETIGINDSTLRNRSDLGGGNRGRR